ncbi:MAG: hypothetical protein WDZ51_14700 [Pirellulaceae bacterium]
MRFPFSTLAYFNRTPSRRVRKTPGVGSRFERLESRLPLSAVPFGAGPLDTGEFMLGDVGVNVVFFESDGSIDTDTETWTESERQKVKQNIEEGLEWWVDMLALQDTIHHLNFVIDYTYADNPVPTGYEPINNVASDFPLWVGDFLDYVGIERSGDSQSQVADDVRRFNHQQRVEADTNWAFTIFVANAENHQDGYFPPGSVRGAFSIAGGSFFAMPSGRPASTVAHETTHQFWAFDEYAASSSYTATRGYYNTQNTNAIDGNPDPDSRELSLMGSQNDLIAAYNSYTTSQSSLETIGWRDSDGNGIFDVLDVPLNLTATSQYDPTTGSMRVVGSGSVGTLANQNSSGTKNSVTINRLDQLEYRVDGGDWVLAMDLDAYMVDFDVNVSIPGAGEHLVEFRLVDQTGLIYSDIFSTSTIDIGVSPGPGVYGTLVYDVNRDGDYDAGEPPLAGWTVSLLTPAGNPAPAQVVIDPDHYNHQTELNQIVNGVTLSAYGSGIASSWDYVMARDSQFSSTGGRSFFNYDNTQSWNHTWSTNRRLRIDLDEAVSRISIDAIGINSNSSGRLEAFDAEGNLLGTYTTGQLNSGVIETMGLELSAPEISYVIVAGHQSAAGLPGTVALDHLQIGLPATAVTNALGGFHLPFHLSGDFQVLLTPPIQDQDKFSLPTPTTIATVNGAVSEPLPLVAFTNAASWHNPVNPLDVLEDNQLQLSDIEAMIEEFLNPQYTTLTELGTREFSQAHEVGLPFFDVDNNGRLNFNELTFLVNTWLLQQEGLTDLAPEPGGTMVTHPGPSGGGDSAGDDIPQGEPEIDLSKSFNPSASLTHTEPGNTILSGDLPQWQTSRMSSRMTARVEVTMTPFEASTDPVALAHHAPFQFQETPLLGTIPRESITLAAATDMLLGDDELDEWLLPEL